VFLKEAELAHLLVDKQYSSCQFKDVITQCLNKGLWYDFVRIRREPATLCSNDAKSCYDLIVFLIMALCMYCMGASKPLVLNMLTTICGMHHHTCTAHGDSQRYAGHSMWAQPIAGIGQGNGANPTIWATVNSPLLTL